MIFSEYICNTKLLIIKTYMKLTGIPTDILKDSKTYAWKIGLVLWAVVFSSNNVLAQWNNLPSMWEPTSTTILQYNLDRGRQREWQNNINPEWHYQNDTKLRDKNIACQNHLVKTWEECWINNQFEPINTIANTLYVNTDEKACRTKKECNNREMVEQAEFDIIRGTNVSINY